MKDYLFRIQVTQQDSFRWRHKISFIKGQELLKKFCIQHAVSSPYNHQSNGEAEAYIKFVKRKRKTSYENIAEIYMSLLHIRSTPVSPRLPIPATLLFNRLARGLLPRFSGPTIICDNDDINHAALTNSQS